MCDFGILAVEAELPEWRLTNLELEERFGSDVVKSTLAAAGIRNRRIAPPNVCASDLAYGAARRLFNSRGISPESIGLLIFCSQSPDYLVPATACTLHERLGLARHCASFDLNLGCSQYIYGLAVASAMLKSGSAERALVMTGDTLTRYVNPRDRSTVTIMGDAGSATLIGLVGKNEGFLGFELGTDGSGHTHLMIPGGGARLPNTSTTVIEMTDTEGNVRSEHNLRMNGIAMFHFSINTVPKLIEALVSRLAFRLEDVDLFLFHQAGRYVIECLMERLEIPENKTHLFFEEVGNTSGSSIPLVLADAWNCGKLQPGMLIVLAGFGAGLSWGASLIRWPSENCFVQVNES